MLMLDEGGEKWWTAKLRVIRTLVARSYSSKALPAITFAKQRRKALAWVI